MDGAVCLTIHPTEDIFVVCSFERFQIKLLETIVCRRLYGHIPSFFWISVQVSKKHAVPGVVGKCVPNHFPEWLYMLYSCQ